MADIDLTTTASVPEDTSLTITVYEDVDGDGNAENSASQSIDDGTNTYTLSGFEFESGNEFWLEAEFDTDDITKTAELDSAGIGGSPVERVEATVTTLQFIPGKEENPSRGGHPLNSGLMQVFPIGGLFPIYGYDIDLPVEPVFDSWMGGDMKDALPETLDEARDKELDKYVDDTGEGERFNEYRFENGIRVGFEVSDGSIDKDTIDINFSEAGPSGSDPIISRGEELPSNTVLHNHELNGIPWEEWYDNSNVRRSNREPRHYEYYTDFEFEGVEGVRVVTCWGGWAGFMEDISKRSAADPAGFLAAIWDWDIALQFLLKLGMMSAPEKVEFFLEAITTIPRTWTFLDFIVLADGRRYARIWDASRYPSLYTYVDGVLKARDDMPYETGQIWNETMGLFYLRAMAGLTPYNNPLMYYDELVLRADTPDAIKEPIDNYLDQLDLGWAADEALSPFPLETLGFDGDASNEDTEALDDPGGPFPPKVDLFSRRNLCYHPVET